jgi:hypothetical protein
MHIQIQIQRQIDSFDVPPICSTHSTPNMQGRSSWVHLQPPPPQQKKNSVIAPRFWPYMHLTQAWQPNSSSLESPNGINFSHTSVATRRIRVRLVPPFRLPPISHLTAALTLANLQSPPTASDLRRRSPPRWPLVSSSERVDNHSLVACFAPTAQGLTTNLSKHQDWN